MSNYLDEGEKIQKIKKLMSTDKYDAGIAKYIIVTLELLFQGMLNILIQRNKQPTFFRRTWKTLIFKSF